MRTEVRLRDVRAEDLPIFFEHQRDPVAVALVAFRSRDRPAFDEHWAKLLTDKTVLKRTIVVRQENSADSSSTQQVVGHVATFHRDGKRELGYWLDRAVWGRGIMSAALAAFLPLERSRPLYGIVAKDNAASVAVLKKFGFQVKDTLEEERDGQKMTFLILVLS